ncbi:peptidase M23 [Epibacterium sp. SM1979]|uniref:Peptidase M23 n=1 Tax=Tritonibacter litoralis TaxID=2662264 RepID=A0A843YF86_9RHOB|nr:peptidase M23 [Tritonibacter litoralis]MQQ09756.1 peptidase M23 [Tritonibacter litoralis]
MKTLLTVTATLAATAPAWAHEGAHLHPHGTEVTPILVVMVVMASAYFFFRSR